MTFRPLIEPHLEFLSLKGGCTDSPASTLVKIPHCWKSHVTAHILFVCDWSLALISTGTGGYCFVVLCPVAPEGSTGSGSGLKRFRRRGHSLKSGSFGSQGLNLGPLGLSQMVYPLHHGSSQNKHILKV